MITLVVGCLVREKIRRWKKRCSCRKQSIKREDAANKTTIPSSLPTLTALSHHLIAFSLPSQCLLIDFSLPSHFFELSLPFLVLSLPY